jgi:cathepsin L
MLSKVCFLSLLAAVAGRTTWQQLENYSFEQFTQEFGLKFEAKELDSRRALFATELARVRAHNAKNLSWKEGVNKFTAMTAAEKRNYHGISKNAAKIQAKSLKHVNSLPADFKMEDVEKLPVTVDWRKSGIVSAVKDQGHCGSCWAFASTATIESHVAKESGLLFNLSPLQIAMCSPNPQSCGGTGGCEGATHELAFDYVSGSAGLFQEFQYGYTAYGGLDSACALPTGTKPVATIDGYVRLPENNYTALMNAIATVGPIAITVDASNWHAYESGVYDGCNQKNPDLDHGVVLVGYGPGYWLIRNSWNANFGEQGYIRIARHANEGKLCGSDITPQDGTACAGQTDPVTACGTCGILYDTSYPLNAKKL